MKNVRHTKKKNEFKWNEKETVAAAEGHLVKSNTIKSTMCD